MLRPSPEAQQALIQARRNRLHAEAQLPEAEEIAQAIREKLAANHFVDLIEATLQEAANRRRRRWGV